MKKNILIISPVYPSKDGIKGETHVVHYFAKEWEKLGYNIVVINSQAVYSSALYKLPGFIYKYTQKIFGLAVDGSVPRTNLEYDYEGIRVNRICIKKILPRTNFTNKAVKTHYNKILSYLNEIDFHPNYIISHWDSPSLLLVPLFRKSFKDSIISLVLHANPYLLRNKGKNKYYECLQDLDYIGFRSKSAMERFNIMLPQVKIKQFICYSGVPDSFVNYIETKHVMKNFADKIWNFIFVGQLITRKYPDVVLEALVSINNKNPFTYTVVGEGILYDIINKVAKEENVSENISFLGKISREEVVAEMIKAQCFIMISKETFGLVYLEAMLAGCIVIASRGEGIDGIIIDGVNGFLCEVGNKLELEKIILKIRSLPTDKLYQISNSATMTAKQYTDSLVAKKYLLNISAI